MCSALTTPIQGWRLHGALLDLQRGNSKGESLGIPLTAQLPHTSNAEHCCLGRSLIIFMTDCIIHANIHNHMNLLPCHVSNSHKTQGPCVLWLLLKSPQSPLRGPCITVFTQGMFTCLGFKYEKLIQIAYRMLQCVSCSIRELLIQRLYLITALRGYQCPREKRSLIRNCPESVTARQVDS